MRRPSLLAIALGGLLAACHGPGSAQLSKDGTLLRYRGPVRLSIAAALVAPVKDSGLAWDGPGQLPEQLLGELRAARPRSVSGELLRSLIDGAALPVVADALHFGANAFLGGVAAPDVQVELLVNGRVVLRTTKVGNHYLPTWSGLYSAPLQLRDFDQLEVRAVDRDVLFHDEIGVCTGQGLPWVDPQGYATPAALTCLGQLWAVALRVVPAEPAPSGALEPFAPVTPGD